MRRAVIAVLLSLTAAVAPAGAQAAETGTADSFHDNVGALVTALSGTTGRGAVHVGTTLIFNNNIGGDEGRVAAGLDCVSIQVQGARNSKTFARSKVRAAQACLAQLPKSAPSTKAIKKSLAAIAGRAKAGRVFGAMATALRKQQSAYMAANYKSINIFGVDLPEVYDDLECADVKIETNHQSGALSCVKRLARVSRQLAPLKPPITFGSDLSATPQALPATFAPEDTEFWDAALTVPADGTITTFRLKTGDSPVDLPLRFSVVRPNGDGTVTVVTTTNPVYPLAAHDATIHTYPTASLSFACCKVRKGDIVTVDNSGTTTPNAYVWFAPQPGTITYSHRSNGQSQNAGVVWTPITHDGFETLVQVVMQPN
ncbi:hypothetical protein [Conexibacter woesei]|uniref:hypothetical protein n=1 Tax=Conexibacter woesei TaxID=191495 RepID=UPI00040CE1F0|nr:hypothetical protein [Conexibacter woesei]